MLSLKLCSPFPYDVIKNALVTVDIITQLTDILHRSFDVVNKNISTHYWLTGNRFQ